MIFLMPTETTARENAYDAGRDPMNTILSVLFAAAFYTANDPEADILAAAPMSAIGSKRMRRGLRTHRDKSGSGSTCPLGRAGVVPKEKARETSATECQIWGHGCGVVVLKAIEQHIRAEQEDCQQAIYKIGRPSRPVTAHFAGSLSWRTDRSALCGRP